MNFFNLRALRASGPISCDIAMLSLRYAPYRAILCKGSYHSPKRVRYHHPPWYLVLHRHICAIPHFATNRVITVRYPIKISTKEFCNTIATNIVRYEEYRCWASRAGGGGGGGELAPKVAPQKLGLFDHQSEHFL